MLMGEYNLMSCHEWSVINSGFNSALGSDGLKAFAKCQRGAWRPTPLESTHWCKPIHAYQSQAAPIRCINLVNDLLQAITPYLKNRTTPYKILLLKPTLPDPKLLQTLIKRIQLRVQALAANSEFQICVSHAALFAQLNAATHHPYVSDLIVIAFDCVFFQERLQHWANSAGVYQPDRWFGILPSEGFGWVHLRRPLSLDQALLHHWCLMPSPFYQQDTMASSQALMSSLQQCCNDNGWSQQELAAVWIVGPNTESCRLTWALCRDYFPKTQFISVMKTLGFVEQATLLMMLAIRCKVALKNTLLIQYELDGLMSVCSVTGA